MYQLDDLLHLMARLRDPQHGCPWDLKQNYATIVPHTIEEAYEVADAIERGDFDHLPGELGDLLFQVVYYSQLAREEGRFEFAQVVDAITTKLIRRHPHVFPDGDLYGAVDVAKLEEAAVKQRWEEIKAEERASNPDKSALAGVALAALVAPQLQQRGVSAEALADGRLARICALFKDRCDTTVALADWAHVFYGEVTPVDAERSQHVTEAIAPALDALADALSACAWDKASISAAFKQVLASQGLKMPQLAMPARVLTVGTAHTPSVDAVLELVGREKVVARLRNR